jgi:hypothetical protein
MLSNNGFSVELVCGEQSATRCEHERPVLAHTHRRRIIAQLQHLLSETTEERAESKA